MQNLWEHDSKVLAQIVEMYEPTGEHVQISALVRSMEDTDEDAIMQSCRRLNDHGYIEALGAHGTPILRIKRVTERGLRQTNAWPDDATIFTDRLIAVLTEAAEDDNEPPEKRSLYQKILQGIGGVGREAATEVMAKVMTQAAGLG